MPDVHGNRSAVHTFRKCLTCKKFIECARYNHAFVCSYCDPNLYDQLMLGKPAKIIRPSKMVTQ